MACTYGLAAQTAVFINEIHYDNTGADVNEGVEIAGPAGTSIAGWTLIPYNGSNGQSYTPSGSFSGTIPDQGGGFGTVFVAISGLQNGSPDGLALVDNNNTVIQFLSYEGAFAATNGPATGLTSVDIGVTENGSNAVGTSLQLTGTGACYEDFTWTGPVAESPGAFNTGQTLTGSCAPPACSLVLGAESAVCNSQTAGPGNDTYDLSIPFSGGPVATTVVNNSGTGSIGGDDPAVAASGTILISGISEDDAYNIAFTAPCATLSVSGAAPSCAPPPSTTIVINEVDADTPGSDVAEFIELFGPANGSLTGMVLVLYNGSNDLSYGAFDLDGQSLDANGFFVAGNAAVPNVDLVLPNGVLQNGQDAVALYFGNDTDFPNNTPVTTVNLIDALVYDTDDADDPGLLVLLNPGQPQVNENGGGNGANESNSRLPDGGTQRNTDTYVQQLPTPGATNVGSCGVSFQSPTATCNTLTAGPLDTYDLSIPYVGVQAGVTVINNSGSGSVGGDDPALVANGTIVISGISETDDYDVALSAPCDLVTVNGFAPVCEPAIDYTVLVINEVDYDQPGTDADEFVEIKNTGAVDINLGGVELRLVNGSNSSVYTTIVLNNAILTAGDYYVVGSATVPNVDQIEFSTNGIQNGAPDAVALYAPGNVLIDVVSYEGDTPGFTEGSGAGLEDITATAPYNNFSISRFPDGTDTDQNNVDFMMKCVTPGATNSPQDDFCACTPATATITTQCIDDFSFNINVNVTDLGSSSLILITEDLNGYFDFAFFPGNYVLGPYLNNDVVTVTLNHDNSLCNTVVAGVSDDCAPPPPCTENEMSLTIDTDQYPDEITWEVVPAGGGAPVCSGGPYFVDFAQEIELCCLADGCYQLTFFDSFGDGIDAPGGYTLRDPNGQPVLISDGTYGSSGSAAQPFCVPIGAEKLTVINCGRMDFLISENVECSENAAVTNEFGQGVQTDDGYQFWFFDADGGYSRRILRTHAASGGFGPAVATRACRLKLSSMVTTPLPFDVMLNVRVRPLVNGTYGEFGPACPFMVLSTAPACPTTQLVDYPGSPNFSCGVTRTFGGSDKISAQPVQGANKYRFRFVNIGEGYQRNIASTNPTLLLNWVTQPLQNGITYDVTVALSFDGGITYCPEGDVCLVTIAGSAPPPAPTCTDGIQNGDEEDIDCGGSCPLSCEAAALRNVTSAGPRTVIHPNPNRGDLLYLTISELPGTELTVNVDIHDLYGKRVVARTLSTQGGMLNTVIGLDGQLAAGMYMVRISIDGLDIVERLVVE